MSQATLTRRPGAARKALHTLAIDVGGTGLKAAVVDPRGQLVTERLRIATPVGAHPDEIVEVLALLVAPLPAYDRVAVGFPGMVRDGRVLTAPNLQHDSWSGYELAARLAKRLGKPVRLCNDADLHGLAVVRGRGIEMVVTLGTGFGTALYSEGRLAPHLELAHLPFRKGETFDTQLGERARAAIGTKRWCRRVMKAIVLLRVLTRFDHLYIGGGNARRLRFALPTDVTLVDNTAGLAGGARLWDA